MIFNQIFYCLIAIKTYWWIFVQIICGLVVTNDGVDLKIQQAQNTVQKF